jgi:putative DNA primase/helicase
LCELPGILRWSLDGLDVLTPQGRSTQPQSSADAMTALQDIGPIATQDPTRYI